MRTFLQKTWRHCLAIVIVLLVAIFVYYEEWMFFPRVIISGKTFGEKIAAYFVFLTGGEYRPEYLLGQMSQVGSYGSSVINIDFPGLWQDIVVYFRMLISLPVFLQWLLGLTDGAGNLVRFLMVFVLFVIIAIVWINGYFSENKRTWKHKSKPLVLWEKFRDGLLHQFNLSMKNYALWFSKTPYLLAAMTMLLFAFNVPSILMDFLGEYFYFFASFNLISICDVALADVISILGSFQWLPFFIRALIVYIIWRIITLLQGNRLVEGKLIPRDEKMVNSDTGVFTLILGKMRGGKTTLATAFARIANTIYHKNAFDNMARVSMMFPDFPFQALEKDIVRLAGKRRIVNMDQAAGFTYRLFQKGAGRPQILYNYDIAQKRAWFYDGACDIGLQDALAIYAESYWIYFHGGNLIASNYPIRTDDLKLDKGHLVLWDYSLFKRKNRKGLWSWSTLSHILVFDMLRFGKKAKSDNKYKDCGGPMVAVATEFGKEHGNMVTNQTYSANGEEANPKNDLLDYSLKLGGHLANVWHTNFFKFIADEQRSGSLSSNLVDVAQTIFTADPKNQEEKCAVRLFWLEPAILDFLLMIRNKFCTKYRYLREDNTLMFHIINSIGSLAYAIESRVYNRYGYKKIRLPSCTADSSGNLKEGDSETFFIINYIDYASRFESACMKDFLNSKKRDADRGFFDLPVYQGLMPSKEEWDEQGSYVVADLEDPTRRFGSSKAPRTRNGSRRPGGADRSSARRGGDNR
jgi:hypothetical protein